MIRQEDVEQINLQNPEVDIIAVLQELSEWQNSLEDTIWNEPILETLDSVFDIIVDNCDFTVRE